VPSISCIGHLHEARDTDRDIRSGKERGLAFTRARVDPEHLGITIRRGPGNADAPKIGQGRSRRLEVTQEPGNRIPIALGIDQDTVLPVPYRPAEPMSRGESVDEWPKADPLDDSFDHDATAGAVCRFRVRD
jgi:hypothetical protein